MANDIFVLILVLFLGLLFHWGFKNLPAEKWQFLAAVPVQKNPDGDWKSVNLTYYGFFKATAFTLALTIWLILLNSIAVPTYQAAAMGLPLLFICIPASRLLARWIEKKKHTATVGGAFFVLILAAPWVVLLAGRLFAGNWGGSGSALPILAAFSIGYTFGEGLGRLACISFGCCYGKPLAACRPWLQRLFAERHFVFTGETKKIAYAHGLDGARVVPVQAMTCVFYTFSGIAGIFLFLRGFFGEAFLLTLGSTQVWRVLSEFLRADYRGEGRISAYQIMAAVAVVYGVGLYLILPGQGVRPPELLVGLRALVEPLTLLLLQGLWAASFLFEGRSMVTGATLSFHVIKERV